MSRRVFNFNPGPAALPVEVLEQARDELLDYRGTGMSILESSHRGQEFAEILGASKALIRELNGFGEDYHILFLTGGASTQFAMVPLNLLHAGESADYVNTGSWSVQAIEQARLVARCRVAGSGEEQGFARLPRQDELDLDPEAVYLHLTSNNTIEGTQWQVFPSGTGSLVCDMSSDVFWRPFDPRPFGLIYAGAQKNLGIAGVTLVIIRDDLLQRSRSDVATMVSYRTHVEKDSLYNTPPVFAIYLMKLVLEWMHEVGGLAEIERRNRTKASRLYDLIDASGGFFRGTVTEPDSRSCMNVTLRLPSEELERRLVAEAGEAGFEGLKGHRSVGGIRVSLYNAVPHEGVEELVTFMREFQRRNG